MFYKIRNKENGLFYRGKDDKFTKKGKVWQRKIDIINSMLYAHSCFLDYSSKKFYEKDLEKPSKYEVLIYHEDGKIEIIDVNTFILNFLKEKSKKLKNTKKEIFPSGIVICDKCKEITDTWFKTKDNKILCYRCFKEEK